MLIFHLYFAIHFYPVCSMCTLQQKLCNPGISIKILFINNKMWHKKSSRSWEQGRSSLCVSSHLQANYVENPLADQKDHWTLISGHLAYYAHVISHGGKYPWWPQKSRGRDRANTCTLVAIPWYSAFVVVTNETTDVAR